MAVPATANRWSEPEVQAKRRRQIEQQQAQIAEFYQGETERQEARIKREASERLAALTRPAN